MTKPPTMGDPTLRAPSLNTLLTALPSCRAVVALTTERAHPFTSVRFLGPHHIIFKTDQIGEPYSLLPRHPMTFNPSFPDGKRETTRSFVLPPPLHQRSPRKNLVTHMLPQIILNTRLSFPPLTSASGIVACGPSVEPNSAICTRIPQDGDYVTDTDGKRHLRCFSQRLQGPPAFALTLHLLHHLTCNPRN